MTGRVIDGTVCVWCLCVCLSWDKEGPVSGPGTPSTPFCPHALPTDKQRLIFERNEAAAAVEAEAAVVLRSEAAAAFAAYITAEAAAKAARVRCVEAAAAAAAHDEAAVVRRVQNKALEPKLAAYNIDTHRLPLSPSVANIKANTVNSLSVVIPSAVNIMPGAFSDTGKKESPSSSTKCTHTP